MHFSAACVAALAASAAALTVKKPQNGAKVSLKKGFNVEWDTVTSDASSFDLYLIDMNVHPNVNKSAAHNVKAKDNHYTIKNVPGIKSGKDYQVNFISRDAKQSGIISQSHSFEITDNTTDLTTATTSSASSTATSTSTGKGNPAHASSTGDASTKNNGAAVGFAAPAAAGGFLLSFFSLFL